MKTYILETHQNGKQLLGSDYSRIVRDCKSTVKLNNAVNLLGESLESLKSIKPFLNDGYQIIVKPL